VPARTAGTSGPAVIAGPSGPAEPAGPASLESRDPLVRRLIELGELHRLGILTDDEFAAAKQSILSRVADLQPESAHQPELSP
jgi:hypothetical protein